MLADFSSVATKQHAKLGGACSLWLSVERVQHSSADSLVSQEFYGMMPRRAAVHIDRQPKLLPSCRAIKKRRAMAKAVDAETLGGCRVVTGGCAPYYLIGQIACLCRCLPCVKRSGARLEQCKSAQGQTRWVSLPHHLRCTWCVRTTAAQLENSRNA